MKLEIRYSRSSEKFLSNNPTLINESEINQLIIRSIKSIYGVEPLTVDLKSLKGEYKGYYRIRKGSIRIIFHLERKEIISVFVDNIDFRGSAY